MFLIPSISMENTLQVDDRVVVEGLSGIERGEVVVFSDLAAGSPAPLHERAVRLAKRSSLSACCPTAEHLIKRVIGLPEDHVICRPG